MNSPTKPESNQLALFSRRTLHVFTLSGFAFAQPILTALLGQSVYLNDQQFGIAEMLILLALLMVVIPLIWVGLDQIVQRITIFFRCPGKNLIIGFLMGILVLSLVRPSANIWWLRVNGAASYSSILVAIGSAVTFTMLYERLSWLRTWLSIASIGLFVFPANFLVQFESMRLAEASMRDRIRVSKPVPVVFIVFDEFSGISLFNSQNEINALRFPQFARLASMSTWYRNATTVNPRTDIAVPSILSGRYPVADLKPLESQYPGNLLQLIKATDQFEMSVFEPVSRLCPESVRYIPKHVKSFEQKCSELIYTLVTVYPRLILAQDTPLEFPRIPKAWFGLPEVLEVSLKRLSKDTKGLFHYPGTEYRKNQQSHLLQCLGSAELPRFTFMHTVFPHFPWCFLPTGEQYVSEFSEADFPLGGNGELGEDWDSDPSTILRNEFRYRMQLGFADKFVGQVLDRLDEAGLLNDCLLIVTADHGVSFRPSNSRRLPGTDNLADILSVPLFIKFPGQTAGQTNDQNVESIDLFPTIADVLGMEISSEVDGMSVLQSTRRPRKTFYFQGKMSIVEPDFPQRWPAIKRQADLYESIPIEQISPRAYRYPEWNGQSLDSFEIDERSIPYVSFKKDHDADDSYKNSKPPLTSNLVWGYIDADELPNKSADVLLTIDGVVIDSMKLVSSSRYQNQFQFVVPSSSLVGKEGKIELFLVNSKDQKSSLNRLVFKSVRRFNY